MVELKTEFTGRGEVGGKTFRQIKASETAYLYEVMDESGVCYEVFKKKVNRHYDCISYPSSKSFGVWAWTYNDYVKAVDKFKEL